MHQQPLPGQQSVDLRLPARADFLPLVQNCVEKGATISGLSENRLMGLVLAAEEIFLHLCQVSRPGERISLRLSPAPTGVDLQFSVKSKALQLGGLNIVATDGVESLLAKEDFNQIGLLLAAGFTDHFSLHMPGEQECILQLRQEREYPDPGNQSAGERHQAAEPFQLTTAPTTQILQLACLQTTAYYPPYLYTNQFRHPGKFADLVLGKELACLLLQDAMGSTCGMICWETSSERAVRFFGPYVFCSNDQQEIARQLTDFFIGRVARTRANIVFTAQATDDLPMQQFEQLGTLDYCPPDEQCVSLQACYRHMREDHGMALWCHPALEEFLRREYTRLVLIRDIRLTGEMGAHQDDTSVFGLDMNRSSSLAIIRPLLDGRDMTENLALHISHLIKQNIHNIRCIIDLGHGWQAAMAGALLEQGFTPGFIQPLAGSGDCVVFQYAAVQS